MTEETEWDEWEEPAESIMRLSFLREVDTSKAKSMRPTTTRNRFQELESTEVEVGSSDGSDGAVGVSENPASPAPYALNGADLLKMAQRKSKLRQSQHLNKGCGCKGVGNCVSVTPTHTQTPHHPHAGFISWHKTDEGPLPGRAAKT